MLSALESINTACVYRSCEVVWARFSWMTDYIHIFFSATFPPAKNTVQKKIEWWTIFKCFIWNPHVGVASTTSHVAMRLSLQLTNNVVMPQLSKGGKKVVEVLPKESWQPGNINRHESDWRFFSPSFACISECWTRRDNNQVSVSPVRHNFKHHNLERWIIKIHLF